MRLSRLEISCFRNLTSVAVDLGPGLNIFHGENGAGKTALLEAVHLLCRGRSFRTQKIQSLIQRDAEQLVVRGIIEDELRGTTTLAIRKDRHSRTDLKVNGEPERRLSEVARLTPLQVMLPDIAELVFGSPSVRRSWLDWGTFHVKPEYLERLRAYLRAIKQRNAQLKLHADPRALAPWSDEVARLGLLVTEDRRDYLDTLLPYFKEVMNSLAPELDVELHYQQGWAAGETLNKLLGDSHSREVKYGSTLWGPHRADVQLRTEFSALASVLSRGQGKMVASALQISQAALLADREKRATVFLIDDAGAELDSAHSQRFFALLEKIGAQVLATMIKAPVEEASVTRSEQIEAAGRSDLVTAWGSRVFHVKHGVVRGE